MKAKKYAKGGPVDPRKKYSKMPETPEEIAAFKEMMWKKKNEISPSAPVGGEAQRTKYEERFMKTLRNRFSKGGKMYMGGGKMMKYLKGGQMKLDANKDGMISKADFDMLRKMKK